MMSGPLTSLKKQRRTPLPSGELPSTSSKWVPFRQNEYTVDESRLLDEVTQNMANTRLKETRFDSSTMMGGLPKLSNDSPRVPNANTSSKRAASSDSELMSLMLSRLSQLEQRLQYQTKELTEKDKTIRILQEKLSIYQKAQDSAKFGEVHALEKKCLLLQQQIHEMEAFLADYGMVWIGEKENPDSEVYHTDEKEWKEQERSDCHTSVSEDDLWMQATSLPDSDNFSVDYEKILANIEDLNAVAGEGIGQVHHTTDGARLKMPDAVPLTLYANGILMFQGPFRPFSDLSTQECMQDILDGFFPSELQSRYPDGIPFKVTDKRTVHFRDKLSTVFQGTGQKLGGESVPSRLVPSNLSKATTTVEDSTEVEETTAIPRAHGPKLSRAQFINKLPKNVVKDGKVLNIRDSIEDVLKGGRPKASGIKVVETPALQDIKDRLEVEERERPPSSRSITTLRVKSETGDRTYILKMRFTETIGDLRKHLDRERPRGAPPYQIMTTFPNKVYTDNKATLVDCNLVPNAALYLRIRK